MKTNETNLLNEKLIEIKELSKILKATNTKTVLNWCKEFEIPVFQINKKKFTYRFLVDLELDKRLISLLQKQYPQIWDKLYDCYLRNESLEFALITETNIVKQEHLDLSPKSKFSKGLLED
ncbi:hypothetical protein AB832_00750 [Flavobacteriaceae bacterium (ex Bugula neritina AB1)]|nr:hypothetical protein AB832_00750 [Flavobacteriaceae bacterium (ex Bugula neritina AB1)]